MKAGYKVPLVAAPVLIFSILFTIAPSLSAGASSDPFEDNFKEEAAAITAEITAMRSARTVALFSSQVKDAVITVDTFKKSCGAVGKRVKELSKLHGVKIRHFAVKYRNPENKATKEEARLLELFGSDRSITGKLDRVEMDGRLYRRYSAPVFVERACLKCHGEKATRPRFVLKKYPDDKAWGFTVGDIRGGIFVLLPL